MTRGNPARPPVCPDSLGRLTVSEMQFSYGWENLDDLARALGIDRSALYRQGQKEMRNIPYLPGQRARFLLADRQNLLSEIERLKQEINRLQQGVN